MTDKPSPLLSVIIPCYNEEEVIPLFLDRIIAVMSEMPDMTFELLFVDDGSVDETLAGLRKLSAGDERVKYLSFSRNFGKEAAMLAGLEAARGDLIAVMDADLQDPPELLPEMVMAVTAEGYDSAAARRTSRKGEPPIRSFFAKCFYKIINKISKIELVDGARDFRLMTRQVVDAVLTLREYNRFSKGIFGWIGFKTKWIGYENIPRKAGATKWSFWKLFRYALDGAFGFSTAPLALSSLFGVLFFLLSIVGVIFIIVRRIMFGDPVAGWASTVSIILFVSGIQLFSIGVLGQYLAKTYLESKRRPVFVVKEKNTPHK